MPTPLNDERAVNTITYLRLNVYQSFLVCLSIFIINQDNNSFYCYMSFKLPFQFIFYCKFDEVAFPMVSTIKTCFNKRE